MAWDDDLGPLAAIVAACAAGGEEQGGVAVDRLVVEMPLELQTTTEATGEFGFVVAPPRQARETSVMPVLHRIRLSVEVTR